MRRWVFAALAFCYVAAVSGPAATDPLFPDARTLRERIAAAAGPPNANYRETIVGRGAEGPNISTGYYRGQDALVRFARGPIRTLYGMYNGAAWHQNANGITVTDAPDPGFAAPEVSTATVGHAAYSRGNYVLSELDRNGYGTRDFVDPATYLIRRHDEIGVAGVTTTTYANYRRFGTQMLPASWRVEDRPLDATTTYERTQFVSGTTTAADVAEPRGRQIVSAPAHRAIDLHARFVGGQIAIPVVIADRTFFFLLDSGASTITIDPVVAKGLGLALLNRNQEIAGNRYETHDTIVPSMDVAGLRMHDVVASAIPLGSGSEPSDPAGLLGFDFLAGVAVRIDYQHQRVFAMDAGSYEPPRGADVAVLDVRLGSQVPMVSADFAGSVAERLIVDTGSAGALLLFDYFARRHHDVLRAGLDRPGSSTGIGGEFASRPYRIPNVRLGHFSFAGLVADVVASKGAYPQDNDGLIGGDLLQNFTVDLDYAAERIVLRRRGLAFGG